MGQVKKIKAGLVKYPVDQFIGEYGTIFYDEDTGSLYLSDGITPGGIPLGAGGGGGVTNFRQLTDTPNSYVGQGGKFLKVKLTENGLEFVAETLFDGDYNSLTNQPDLSVYQLSSTAFDGDYNNLTNKPDLSVYQLSSTAFSGDYADLTNKPSIPATLNDFTDVTINTPADYDVLMYNSGTLQFENRNINLTGGTANQVLVKQSANPLDYAWEDMIINVEDKAYTKLLDQVTAELLYLGEAIPESLESAPAWRIQKITFDSSGNVLEVRFAEGGLFDQIWNNRALLTYA